MRPASKLLDCFSLHGLSDDELATAGSMAERDRSARVLMMPTHHFGEYGDLTGFRFDCSGAAAGSCLPVSRRMFFGHTMVECGDTEQNILRVMSQPERNKEILERFLDDVEARCAPASSAPGGAGTSGICRANGIFSTIGLFIATPL